MKKYAYYNEHDKFAAAWLRELIKDGLIADGIVDERDIQDVTPNDVADFCQCHYFAGIGGWSLALRLAGWPDDKPVWTGSAPCQPFSDAGKGVGFSDERHLWPSFFWLIQQCRPDTIFGEQVSSKAGLEWFDVVSSDLEAAGYAVGAFDLCAPSVGAFHIRQRLYFVADANDAGPSPLRGEILRNEPKGAQATNPVGPRGSVGELADANGASAARLGEHGRKGQTTKRLRDGLADSGISDQLADPSIARIGKVPAGQRRPGEATADVIGRGGLDGLAHTPDTGLSQRRQPRKPTVAAERGTRLELQPERSGSPGVAQGDASRTGLEKRPGQPGNAGQEQSAVERTGGGSMVYASSGSRNGQSRRRAELRPASAGRRFWDSAEWIICRDGKARPVEPSIFPLSHGIPNRVGTLRGAGNAIVPQLAAEFIVAYREYKEQG